MQTDSPPEQGTPQSLDRVLSSMCTEPHPAAREAAERFLATNPGDPDTYQSVAELEAAVVAKLGDVIGLSEPHGYVASGGTEANIQAVRAARNRSAESDPNIVAPESAHFSFEKAAEMLDVELRMAATGPNHRAAPDAMEALVDDSTALIVGVAGSTEHGRVDPIPELGRIAESADAQFHVDAAFGGFLLPFTDVAWDFSDAPVDTMTIDPHKVGQAAIPSGGFIAREEATLQALAIETPYLESDSQVSLGGTRSGAGVASAHAALEELWPDGYEANFHRTMSLARWFADQLAARDYQVADLTLPIVTWSMEEPLFEALREQGWRLARTGHGAVRVVVMPHVTEPILESFLADLDQIRE